MKLRKWAGEEKRAAVLEGFKEVMKGYVNSPGKDKIKFDLEGQSWL